MYKSLLITLTVFSALSFVACNKKDTEKVGYERVYQNIYKSERVLIDFVEPTKCLLYVLDGFGIIDSNAVYQQQYSVFGDSVAIGYNEYLGLIEIDRLILKWPNGNEFIFNKVNK